MCRPRTACAQCRVNIDEHFPAVYHAHSPRLTFPRTAVLLVVHTVVVAQTRFRAVFVRAQTVGVCIRDTQLLERTAKAILCTQMATGVNDMRHNELET